MYKNSGPRQEILRLLKTHGSGTVASLANQLNLVPVTVRSHLTALAQQGLVESRDERGRVGRPRQRFSLTSEGDALFPKRYAGLSAELIESLKTLAGQRGLEQVLDAAATRYAGLNRPPLRCTTLQERVAWVTGVLEEESGMATCERVAASSMQVENSSPRYKTTASGTQHQAPSTGRFVIHDFNCPYRDVALQHNEVCRYHLQVVSKLIGQEVTLDDSIARGGSHCVFSVQERKLPAAVGVRVISDGRVGPARQ